MEDRKEFLLSGCSIPGRSWESGTNWGASYKNMDGVYQDTTDNSTIQLGNSEYSYRKLDPEMREVIEIGKEEIRDNQYSFRKRIIPEVSFPSSETISRNSCSSQKPVVINIYQNTNSVSTNGNKKDSLLENYYKNMYNTHDIYTSAPPPTQSDTGLMLNRYQEIVDTNHVPLTDTRHDTQWNPDIDYSEYLYGFASV